jgi:hypothetical protein
MVLNAAADLVPLLDRQRWVAIGFALGVVLLVIELVRRRKLREEYSWVWMATAVAISVLAWRQDLLLTLSRWIGSSTTVSTLFFGALVFLFALALQFSVRLSRLTLRHKTLAQRFGLLEQEVRELQRQPHHQPVTPIPRPTKPVPERDEVA